MQEFHQLLCDDGIQADHTFRFAKMIMAAVRKGKVFHASYDALSLDGFINFNRFTHTKSNDEIRPLLEEYRQVRLNAGVLKLKRAEHNGGSDKLLCPTIFPELEDDTRPFKPREQDNMPVAKLPEDQYIVIGTITQANDWALSLMPILQSTAGPILYGLDTENNDDETYDITRVISITFTKDVSPRVAVFHLSAMGVFDASNFPENLKEVLELKNLIPVAVQVGYDWARLSNLGIQIKLDQREVMDVAKILEPNNDNGYGVKSLSARLLGICVDKFGQHADYSGFSLSKDLGHYCALDPHLHLRLYTTILEAIQAARDSGQIPNSKLAVGQSVQLLYKNRTCAFGVLEFIGAEDGKHRKWGTKTIGCSTCQVRVTRVTMHSVRPPLSYQVSAEEPASGIEGWTNSKVLLGDLFRKYRTDEGLVVGWPTKCITVQLESIEQLLVSPTAPQVEINIPAVMETNRVVEHNNNNDDNEYLSDDDEDYDEPRACSLCDRFHLWDAIPCNGEH